MHVALNESKTDRTVRILAGLAVVVVGLVVGSWWGLVGLIPLVTGLAGWCPLYAMFGFRTNRSEQVKFQPGSGTL